MDGRAVLIDVSASAPLVSGVNRAEVRSTIAGLDVEAAQEVLSNTVALSAPPLIEVEPEWIKRWEWLNRVPLLPFRIQVIVLE